MPRRMFSKTGWLRLNSDGVLIATLALYAGFFDLIQPGYQALTDRLGYQPPTYFVWNTLYILGGCVMLIGFFRRRIAPELCGRLLIYCGSLVEFVRIASAYGWGTHETYERLTIVILLTFFFVLRASVMLNPRGLAVVFQGRDSFKDPG